jgi:hypothetical protein
MSGPQEVERAASRQRTNVKGQAHVHGFKICFETTWLDQP